ncbi:class I SAM-dependent methyltransferase [Sphingomonas bacterium]|uniref:class I SAM-dependent methyltransferase n=1 Tax=Sphingomonas bacterium TaxID=1895847 RepID=UPI0015766464|nr:class I SAM-dependent methyltransferase [Sphingomonas bacterium]
MSRIHIPAAIPAVLGALLACSAAGPAHGRTPSPAIAAAIADPARPDADRVRDANRKPAEVLAFAGIRPGMIVAELGSGGGYYTRILARAVGSRGKVFAIVTAAQAARPNGLKTLDAIALAYPNVVVVTVSDYAHATLPAKADLFWTTENYHDFHNGPTADIAGLDRAVFGNLKAGGIFYVEDHSAAPGAGLAATSTLHRMDEDVAKSELRSAGFRLEAEGASLHNVGDDRSASNSETGHFNTDRFMLRMRR